MTQELEAVLQQLQREAASLGLLAALRERAGLTPTEAAAVQRALAPVPDAAGAPRTPLQTRAVALLELLRVGCPFSWLHAVACSFPDTEQPGSGRDTVEEAAASAAESTSEPGHAVQEAVQTLLQQCMAQLRSGEAAEAANALCALDKGLCASLEDRAAAKTGTEHSGNVELLQKLRGTVWDALQHIALQSGNSREGGHVQASDGVLHLLNSLAPPSSEASASARWATNVLVKKLEWYTSLVFCEP